ncbi:MAG TPA: RagB/SusD family nutrient uptake outer membrane protein [Chryseosolibacter sp.]|nr:RagB/SusD family nutrient uptake outer membrane protein [Chryseosolibacter sp.]
MKSKYILVATLTVLGVLSGCSDEFLERPPQDTLVDANFYKTDEQVLAATAGLYSAVWKDYIDKANFKLGDFRGGTAFRAWGDRDHVLFNTTSVSPDNGGAYRSFYITVGQANMAIQNINMYAGDGVSAEIKNHAIAEARFMRAVAYSHLVMNYGPVPIIENNLEHLADPMVRRNTVESIWEFITRDFEFAAENLLEEAVDVGRITKWSAEGMLARTWLTRAGVGYEGTRNEEYLAKARDYAERVITMSGKALLKDYAALFRYPYDNQEESLFELQWVYTPDYTYANTMVSQITYSNDIANGDGWGGDIGASWWMLSLYDGLMVDNGATPGFTLDQRLKATFMLPGFEYPEISQTVRDETGEEKEQDLVFPKPADDAQNSFASIKKYVVGKSKDLGGEASQQRYPNNTYMMRLAEMYLIYAEAVLGNNASTSDAKALAYFNAVHQRAGLPEFTEPLTWDVIFEERIKEFAMESMAWYDLVRLHYYNAEKAYEIINNQDRGLFVVQPDRWPNPTGWTFTKTSWFNERYAVANEGNFLLPLPAAEVSQAPILNEEPVPYEFSE